MAAVSKIENIRVECDSHKPCVLWEIGADRFHVWLDPKTNEAEETVFKNSVAKHKEPGYYSTRKLDRASSKATAKMFDEVSAFVDQHDLIGKAHRAEEDRRLRDRRLLDLKNERLTIEQLALTFWRQAAFDKAERLHARYCEVLTALADAEAAQ